jgi:hypothetical protein
MTSKNFVQLFTTQNEVEQRWKKVTILQIQKSKKQMLEVWMVNEIEWRIWLSISPQKQNRQTHNKLVLDNSKSSDE